MDRQTDTVKHREARSVLIIFSQISFCQVLQSCHENWSEGSKVPKLFGVRWNIILNILVTFRRRGIIYKYKQANICFGHFLLVMPRHKRTKSLLLVEAFN